MKILYGISFLGTFLLANENIVVKNDYSSDVATYRVESNKHGMVLNRKKEKIYLGKSCDVFFKREGKGHWGYYTNGSIWLKFENEVSYTIKDELPKKYGCPTKDIKIEYDDIYAKCVGNNSITNTLINACAGFINHLMEKKIQHLYTDLLKKFKEDSPNSIEKLKDSQKMWQLYKDSECDLEGWAIGTPMYDLCPVEINKERIKRLESLRN